MILLATVVDSGQYAVRVIYPKSVWQMKLPPLHVDLVSYLDDAFEKSDFGKLESLDCDPPRFCVSVLLVERWPLLSTLPPGLI